MKMHETKFRKNEKNGAEEQKSQAKNLKYDLAVYRQQFRSCVAVQSTGLKNMYLFTDTELQYLLESGNHDVKKICS